MTPLDDLFPTEEQIPADVRLPGYLEQREYLSGGELRTWTGELSPVQSPVYVKTEQGPRPRVIGATPLLTSRESLEALHAAVKAHDHGRGHGLPCASPSASSMSSASSWRRGPGAPRW